MGFLGCGYTFYFGGLIRYWFRRGIAYCCGNRGIQNSQTYTDTAAVDVSKLLEALSKLPQWAVAVVFGNLQILLGFWMLGATLFGYKMLP